MDEKILFKKIDTKKMRQKLLEKEPDLQDYLDIANMEYQLVKKLVEVRKTKKLTQGDISKKTGIKQQVISRFERVDSLPTLRTFIRYLDSMDLEIEIKEKNKLKKN